MSVFPLKVGRPFWLILGHTEAGEGLLFTQAEVVSLFERVDERWNLQVSVEAVPAGFQKQKGRAYPAKTVIATLPAFDLTADPFDSGKARFDEIGAGQRSFEATTHAEFL
jgi:hypothetical protein